MALPALYPAQVGSPYTTLAAPYTSGGATMTVVDATKLPDAPNIVCLAGSVAGEFRYSGKDGNTLLGVVKLPGTPNATWPAGTFAFRGISAYDHASIVEHLTFQRSHIVEATLDLTTNHTYSGRVLDGAEAGENLAFGDLAVLAESGKFVKANPAALATLDGTIALVVSDTIAAGSQGMFLLRGLIRNDSWTFSPGKELYASNGTLTHEPPTTGTQIIRKVGTALTATIIEFNPSSTLHAEYLVSVLPVNTVTKDNGDVERKFWKDDFSVDSSDQYETISGSTSTHSYDTDHIVIPDGTGIQLKHGDVAPKKFSMTVKQTGITGSISNGSNQFQVRFTGTPSNTISEPAVLIRFSTSGADNKKMRYEIRNETGETILNAEHTFADTATYYAFLNSYWGFEIAFGGDSKVNLSIPLLGINTTSTKAISLSGQVRPYITTYNLKKPLEVYEITSSPSISYADDFTSDTTERYQAVTGTVAYDDVNKRMNVTTAAGANGKASGRLKSYKFCEGAQQFDVTLPVGDSGDFICMVTHATDAKMTNGIGVGLQSDGAGNWNLATLSGTTVTEGASSGLVDGKTARIEIEKDLSGAYWYYIYDAAGAKPTTPTGKLFTTLSEGYTGWYAKGNNKTYAIENISIRAESIVGRTNVEVTEPFWFRDEFGEDSRGRYWNVGSATITGGKYKIITNWYHNQFRQADLKNIDLSATFTPTHGTGTYYGYGLAFNIQDSHTSAIPGATGKRYVVHTTPTNLTLVRCTPTAKTALVSIVAPTPPTEGTHTIRVTDNDSGEIVVYYDGEAVITHTDLTYTHGYVGFACGDTNGTGGYLEVDDLQFSGTRIYNRPIHRGAMLETYHDGTQEVVGTTFIDDCQWDRSAEYTSERGTWTHDPITGVIRATANYQGLISYTPKGITFNGGVIDFDLWYHKTTTYAPIAGIIIFTDGNSESALNGIPLSNSTFTREHVDGVKGPEWPKVLYDAEDVWVKIRVVVNSSNKQIVVYRNGTQIWSRTYTFTPKCYGISLMGYNMAGAGATIEFRNLVVNGVSVDASNGIAACIPPIGGGARYGVEESVYIPITPGTEIPVGSAVISPNAKSTVVGTALTTFAQSPAGVSASLEYATGTKTCPGLSTAFAPVGRHRVKADRNTLTNIGVKGSVAGTSPAVYIDSLHVRKQEVA